MDTDKLPWRENCSGVPSIQAIYGIFNLVLDKLWEEKKKKKKKFGI